MDCVLLQFAFLNVDPVEVCEVLEGLDGEVQAVGGGAVGEVADAALY